MNLPHRTSAPRHVVLWFDFADPRCFLASARIARACHAQRCSLLQEPVHGAALGATVPAADDGPAWERILAAAEASRVRLVRPSRYPFDSTALLRTCVFVRDRSGLDAMTAVADRIWHQVWQEGADPVDPKTALRAGREAAIPEAALRAGLADPEVGALLDRITRRAAEHGVHELPALEIDHELLVGLPAALTAEGRLNPDARSDRPATALPDWTFGG